MSSASIDLTLIERDCAQLGLRAVFPNTIAEARGQRGNFHPNGLRRLGVDLEIDIALRDQAE